MLQPMRLQRAGQDLVTEQQLGFTVCIFSHSILSSNNYSTSSIMQNLSTIYYHVPHAFLCSTVVLEFEQALGVGDGQGNQACCSPRSHKEWDTTERLN